MASTISTQRLQTQAKPSKLFQLSTLSLMCLGAVACAPSAQASLLSGKIGYQTYLDFAKNRGAFKVGTSQIDIVGVDGTNYGAITAPMMDWSVTDTSGIATLVNPSYIVSVKHNVGYYGVQFGDGTNQYWWVERNESWSDLHAPRLSKIVTEVAPIAMVSGITSQLKANANWIMNGRFTNFLRMGSGTQEYRTYGDNNSWKNNGIAGAYIYLTGGTIPSLKAFDNGNYLQAWTATQLDPSTGNLLPNHPNGGDSGSPLVAWDTVNKNWVIVGVTSSKNDYISNYTTVDDWFVNQKISEDTDAPVNLTSNAGTAIWTYDKDSATGQITQGNTTFTMHGKKGNDSNAGKNIAFNGGGSIDLQSSIDLGAGVLTLNGNYTFKTSNQSTWMGGGIILGDGANVNWQINGVANDALHIVGHGTFTQNGVGVNQGSLKVGYNTTVILNQQADVNGQIQAFSGVNLSSGSSKVVLTNANQINPDTITWGYRGGTFDINGNDLTFHKLTHSDSGAILANLNEGQRATVTLDYATKLDDIKVLEWSDSKKGTVGDVYCAGGGGCWVLKRSNYSWFPDVKQSNSDWEWIGYKNEGAVEAGKLYGAGLRNNMMFHGQFQGNMNIVNKLDSHVTQPFVLDGAINITGTFEQENGRLTFQGHPELHGYVSEGVANTIKNVSGQTVNTTPTTFDQSDWETRVFSMDLLKLTNTDFGLARNAILNTTIEAKGSKVTIGDERVFIDAGDGAGQNHTPNQGRSTSTTDNDLPLFAGVLNASQQSEVTLKGRFVGDLNTTDSRVVMASKYLNFNHVRLKNSELSIDGNSEVHVNESWFTDQAVKINSSTFKLQASTSGSTLESQEDAVPVAVKAGYYEAPAWKLSGPTSTLEVGLYGVVNGDITMDNKNTLSFTGEGSLLTPTTEAESQAIRRLNGFGHAWRGSINGDWGTAKLDNTLWLMTKSSNIETLTLTNSMISWRNVNDTTNPWALLDTQNTANDGLTSLTVKNLTLNNSGLIMRTRGQESDRLTVTGDLKGANNQLYVNYVTPSDLETLNTPLITVKGSMDKDAFKAGTLSIGFTHVTPIFEVQKDDATQGTKVVLTGFNTQADYQATRQAQDVLNLSYQGFVSEVNNMNLRMGELRDNPLNSGAWVRLTQAGGSTDTSDNDWFGVQTGADRQIRFASGSTYLGALLTYTHGQSSGDSFSSQGDSYGLGVYASTVLDSGLYVDAIAKYVRTKNDYTFAIGGQQAAQLGQNLFYAGAEVGYRYQVSASSFVEPQGELVLGYLSAQDFAWQNADSTGRMHQDASTPLYGRMGVVYGKHFEGQNWKLDARIGGHYEFDLTSMGDMLLQDQANSQTVDAGRDGRFVYSLGVNAEVGKNTRIGVELQRSAFGRYNLDHLVNANVRYSF